MWRHIAQSLQGPSHVADGTCCQDRNSVRLLGENSDAVLVASVADGAGSARHSDVGSRIACDTIDELAAAYFLEHGSFDGFERDDACRWCEEIHSRIQFAAGERDCTAREMATTLSVVIASPASTNFFQIGDGGIVVGSHGIYGIVFWPQSGEYANSTNFVTSQDYREQLDFLTVAKTFSDVALLTDGLERLAFAVQQQTPHTPFFSPLFKALRGTSDLEGLNADLKTFLGSKSVQDRSDDDKTLILASRESA